jgi:hypothetical protein
MVNWSKIKFPFFGNKAFFKNPDPCFSKTRNTGSGQKMLKKFFKKMQPFLKRGEKSFSRQGEPPVGDIKKSMT